MNLTAIFKPFVGLFILPLILCFFVLTPVSVQAQDTVVLDPAERYSEEELAQMLAPIALYPDALLSQILMASTYPIEVIEADRWLRENSGLQGDPLDGALIDKGWDPSVKAICHFPSILALMSERISETTNLGNAFLAQEAEVMGMIQKLRVKAYEQGNLNTTAEQKVIVEKETIIIEPANPRIVYIPYYDPYYVYAPWWWAPGYPPYIWGPVGVNIGVGISFWPGVYFSVTFINWSYFDWDRSYVYIDLYKRPRFVRHDHWISTSGRWSHVPLHRRGVAYRDMTTARKYGQSPKRTITYRREARGFPTTDQGELKQPAKLPKVDSSRQEQQRVERKIKELGQVERGGQERHRIQMEEQTANRKGTEKLKPVRTENKRQERIQLAPQIQKEQRVESKRPDAVFNRLEDGELGRQYSERGRESRRNLRGENDRDRNDSSRSWRRGED